MPRSVQNNRPHRITRMAGTQRRLAPPSEGELSRKLLLQRVLVVVVSLALVGMLVDTEEMLVHMTPREWNANVPQRLYLLDHEQNQTAEPRDLDWTWNETRMANWIAIANDQDFAVRETNANHSNVTWHSTEFITRGEVFDSTVSRDRGIIIALHDRAFALGMSLVSELRCLGNRELIQIYYCTEEDLSQSHRQILTSQDDRLETVDVCSDLVHAGRLDATAAKQFKNWWVKPLAIYHTDLNHPLLLDADDILLKDPALARDTAQYQATGTLFFYDRVIPCRFFLTSESYASGRRRYLHYILQAFQYTTFGLVGPAPSAHVVDSFAFRGESCHEMDSSMVAIDKTRAGLALDVLWWLITELRHRLAFSWGDKESFWLAFELAQRPYAFSQWGVSVISSSTNHDMEAHPDSLCGSIAQFVPSTSATPKLFYVNGRALLDPLTQGVENARPTPNILYNANPTHVVPLMSRSGPRPPRSNGTIAASVVTKSLPSECLVGFGSTPLPDEFAASLYRRRRHYLDVVSGLFSHVAQCNL